MNAELASRRIDSTANPEEQFVKRNELQEAPRKISSDDFLVNISLDNKKRLKKELRKEANLDCILNNLIGLSELSDDDSAILKENLNQFLSPESYGLDIESAIKTIRRTKEKMVGFDGISQEIILKSFGAIALKKYYTPEEIDCFFSSVNFQLNPADHNNFAKIDHNRLIIFEEAFKQEFSREQFEFLILHEIGHIVDASKVLESQIIDEEGVDQNNNDKFLSLLQSMPIELQNQYSIDVYKNNPDEGLKELKAHFLAMWAKNRNDPVGFTLDRINRTNAETIETLFKDKRKFVGAFKKAFADKDLNILADRSDNPELVKELIKNSSEIFEYLEKTWKEKKEELGDTFYDLLSDVNTEQKEFDFYEEEPTEQITEAEALKDEDSTLQGDFSDKKTDFQKDDSNLTPNKTSKDIVGLSDVYVSTKELLKSMASGLDIFGFN